MRWASCYGEKCASSSETDALAAAQIPLAGWADGVLNRLACLSGSSRIASLTGGGLLGERAYLNGFRVPGKQSAGGGCRLFDTSDGAVALNLARMDDRALLPALFGSEALCPGDEASIAAHMLRSKSGTLVARGRELGLAIASVFGPDANASPAIECRFPTIAPIPSNGPPLVVDLSALWAGPLAAHLLWLAGARVIKVESPNRLDAMRNGDSRFFDLLNQGKQSVMLDIRDRPDRDALMALLAASDIVIESARPRALAQLGIDADELVRTRPGLVWVSITGHGVQGDAAHWVGFGDDCGVAGGLTSAMQRITGQAAFVGDAVADPLTGILAAHVACKARSEGRGGRYFLSMSSIAALALREEMARDTGKIAAEFESWARARGQCFAPVPSRDIGPVAPPGRDTRAVLAELAAC